LLPRVIDLYWFARNEAGACVKNQKSAAISAAFDPDLQILLIKKQKYIRRRKTFVRYLKFGENLERMKSDVIKI